MNRVRVVAVAVVAAGVVWSAGCSKEGKYGAVAGKVTLDGKPVEGAALTFLGPDGRTATASTDATGQYRSEGVPVGAVLVGVASLPEPGEDQGTIQKNQAEADPRARETPPPSGKKRGPRVPDRYADPGASGLTHTVTEGLTTYDIPLTK
jgi:hypothetical protein